MSQKAPLQTQALCVFRWSYPIFYMFDRAMAYCCRTESQPITDADIQQYGAKVFSEKMFFRERRREMIFDQRHKDCHSCWSIEDSGVKSPRLEDFFTTQLRKVGEVRPQENLTEFLRRSRDRLVSGQIDDSLLTTSAVDILEVVLSNACGFKCVYCNEFYSSSWAAEKRAAQRLHPDYRDKTRDPQLEALFYEWVEANARDLVKRLGYIGGEPIAIEAFYESLERMREIFEKVPARSRKPELCITTNLCPPDQQFERFTQMIPKMETRFRWVVQVSMESVGSRAEYIRFGTNWSRLERNLHRLLRDFPNVEVAILPTLNLLALPSLPEFLSYLRDLHKQYGRSLALVQNMVTLPRALSPLSAPREFAEPVRKSIALLTAWAEELAPVAQFDRPSEDEVVLRSREQASHWRSYAKYLDGVAQRIEMNFGVDGEVPRGKEKESQHHRELWTELRKELEYWDLRRGTSALKAIPEIAEIWRQGEGGHRRVGLGVGEGAGR